ncbi:MAG: c-type cytochrome [Steroidobacteraceae bacterium]
MKALKVILIVLAVVLAAGLGFVYSGVFNVAADDPHWDITLRLIESTRDRAIAARAREVGAPPALEDPELLAMGAEHYAEMCTDCHLAPGMKDTETRAGLYPRPPNLAEHAGHRAPAETFWIIKHGLKMTGMPAWGVTHDDESIWGTVALVRKLPELSASQYEELVARGRGARHAHGAEEPGHAHGDELKPHSHDPDQPHAH